MDLVRYLGSESYEIGRYSAHYTYKQRAELEYQIYDKMVALTKELILNTGNLFISRHAPRLAPVANPGCRDTQAF